MKIQMQQKVSPYNDNSEAISFSKDTLMKNLPRWDPKCLQQQLI